MAEKALQKIILIGAGGNLGPSVLKALKSDPNFEVSILARNSSRSTFPAGVKVHKVADDYPEQELIDCFLGQDAVVSMVGVADVLKQVRIIDAAIKAGVRRFIPSEFGANKDNAKTASHPAFAKKQEVIAYLKSKEGGTFSWTGIANGLFLDWGLMNGFLGFDIQARKALIYDTGDVTWSATTLATVGLAVAKVLREPSATANKFVFVSSVTTSQSQILSILQKVTVEEWAVEHITTDAALQSGQKKLSMGDASGFVPIILSLSFQEGWGGDFTQSVHLKDRLLGLPEESMEDLITNILK